MKIYEPEGIFRIVNISKPLFSFESKIWFTQTLTGIYQLHVGIFDKLNNQLKVWKSRTIHPKIKFIQVGMYRHSRNSLLDEPKYRQVIRLPFLNYEKF